MTPEQYEVDELIDSEMHHLDSVIRNGLPVLVAGAPAERRSGYIIFPPIDSTVQDRPGAEELTDPWVVDKQIDVKARTGMKASSGCSENTGMFVFSESSEAELMDRIGRIGRIGRIRPWFRLEVSNNASSCCSLTPALAARRLEHRSKQPVTW